MGSVMKPDRVVSRPLNVVEGVVITSLAIGHETKPLNGFAMESEVDHSGKSRRIP